MIKSIISWTALASTLATSTILLDEEYNKNIYTYIKKTKNLYKKIMKESKKEKLFTKPEIWDNLNFEIINIKEKVVLKIENLSNKIKELEKVDFPLKEKRLKDNYYSKVLLKDWLSKETNKLVMYWINKYLIWKYFLYNWNKVIFTKTFLKNNSEWLKQNITSYLIFLMNIESNGWYVKAENPNSSAKWPLQWLDWYKNWQKIKSYNRKKWKYTSFETALRRSDKFFNDWIYTNFKNDNTPEYLKDAWNNWWKLNLSEFSPDHQIDLWFVDLIMRGKKSKKLLMWIMLWSYWSAKKTYKDLHHTNPDKNTLILIDKKIKKIKFKKFDINDRKFL